jgi:geranylgeranyl diphosphate synthase type II
VADDICDATAKEEDLGKPTGRDATLGRPNAVGSLGLGEAKSRLQQLVAGALDAIPSCPGADGLRASILGVTEQLIRPRRARPAA